MIVSQHLHIGRILSPVLLTIFIFIGLSVPVWAEVITYTHTVRQPFNGSQSPDDARIAALAKAKREVLEKAGTYLDSIKIVKDQQLVQNQITALSAAILQAEIVSQKNYVEGETFGIEIEAKVIIDPSTLEERIKNFLKDQSALAKAERLEQREKELLAKVKELEERSDPLNRTKNKNKEIEGKKGNLSGEFAEISKKITAVEANRKALVLWDGVKFIDPEKAVAYLNEAIRKDDHFADAYNNRGAAYTDLEQWQRAIQDYGRAIMLEPHFSDAINNRGAAYARLGEMQKAVQDFDIAIKLNQSNATFYFNRGTAYANLGQFEQACQDLDKAVELAPIDISIRISRGIVLFKSELYEDAISDFDYILFKGDDALAYKYRGLCYHALGEKEKFCYDLELACIFGDCDSLKTMREKKECNKQYLADTNKPELMNKKKSIDIPRQPPVYIVKKDIGNLPSINTAKRSTVSNPKSDVYDLPQINVKATKRSTSRPITMEAIENALIANVNSHLIAKKIREKGVDFELNEENRSRLNKAKVDEIVINAIIETKKKKETII